MGCGRPLCRHDGGPSSSVQAARQDRCVRRGSECALLMQNGHGAEFLIAKSARSRADRYLPCQFRTGFASGHPSCYRRQHPSGPYGEYRFNQFGDLERCSLRPGNVHSADGWRDIMEPVVERYRGRTLRRYFRGDAAFALPDLSTAAQKGTAVAV